VPTLPSLSRARTPVGDLVRSAGFRAPSPSVSRLRAAVTALFVLDGAVFGSWAARVPDVAARVGAGHSTLGIALLCLSLGALVCMRFTGGWCARFGAGPVSAVAAVAVSAAVLLPGLVYSVPALCVALFVFGAATGMVNVAANAVGVQVEASVGRPLLSGLHAGFSLGGLGGALVGGAASSVLGVGSHLALVAAAGLFASAWSLPALLGARRGPAAGRPPATAAEATRRPTAVLVVLGAIAGCTAFGEGALTDWGALLLREHLAAPATVAAAGYAGFSLAMAGGRLAGGRLLQAMGERRLLVGGAVLAAAGAVAAVTTSSLVVALAGVVLVGLGLANVFPLAIGRAGLLGGARGIALATTVGYTGLLGGPPAIGLLADSAGLPLAVGSVAVMALIAAVLVLTVSGEQVRLPRPRILLDRAVAVGGRLQPVVSGFGHGTGVYVRDLQVLVPGS
jgi:MFS family permease